MLEWVQLGRLEIHLPSPLALLLPTTVGRVLSPAAQVSPTLFPNPCPLSSDTGLRGLVWLRSR